MFRSRPIVVPSVVIEFNPSTIPLVGNNSYCSQVGGQLCFQTVVTISYIHRGDETNGGKLPRLSKFFFVKKKNSAIN